MPSFQWLGAEPMRHGVDLRFQGWRLNEAGGETDRETARPGGPAPVMLVDAAATRLSLWRMLMQDDTQALRRRTLVIGVEDGGTRARLLALGFGDVVGPSEALSEIAVRASRIAAMVEALPRRKSHGPLTLDLMAREAFLGNRALGLFPREFALLWRLMETPGQAVAKRDLLREVWHLTFVPETNSLAVHASRLRAKLALAGLDGWVRGDPAGGYVLTPDEAVVFSPPPAGSSRADCKRH